MRFCLCLAAFLAGPPMTLSAAVTTSTGVVTNPLNLEQSVRQAYEEFYILDYDGAFAQFKKIEAAHPTDPIAVDYVLNVTLFRELYRLDLLDTTFYAHDGFLTGKRPAAHPDPDVSATIALLAAQAEDLADQRLKADPKDVDALYARGWAHSLDALYVGLVERRFIPALHLALQARSDNEKVLELNRDYIDAKLVLGVHMYIVGSLPLGFKLIAGIAGITGSKTKGMKDLRDAGSRGVITSVEARTALALFLRREARYGDAVVVMKSLGDQYPRDFLFRLEVANLTKDAGNGPLAIAEYRSLLTQARKPGYFPLAHLELAWFGLGETLRGQNDYLEAANAYRQAVLQPTTSVELKGRSMLNAGEMYDLAREREKAEEQYRAVLQIEKDSSQADSARRYLESPYRE